MSSAVLSQAQFGPEPPMAGTGDQALSTPEPIREPRYNPEASPTPLPYNSDTNSSAKQAAVWRKPRNLSYSTATSGAVFTPYGGS